MEQNQVKADVTIYGPQPDHRSPCVIVRKGQDPNRRASIRSALASRTAVGTSPTESQNYRRR